MKDKILADTSVWIEFFKKDSEIGDKLSSLLAEGSVTICGIVIFELLQGIKSDKEKSIILNAISELPYIEMDSSLWQKSAMLAASLRRKGITLPLSDVIIASIVLEHNLSIFTLDKHFDDIPEITIYKP
ncbi:MAG TPA: PIN domain-containing protein [Syntrophorhabdaceae bacterium]|nr:PIN domain-containing protein [Syntrophorhabdaceae bacterium]